MAIVEMKRVSLLGMASERDKLLRALQRAGCVEITEIAGDGVEAYRAKERYALDAAEEKLSRIRWAMSQLGRFEKKQGMLASMSMPEADADEAARVAQDEAALMDAVSRVEAIERRSGELRGVEARVKVEMEQLAPWTPLRAPVEMLHDTRDTLQFVGTVPAQKFEELENAAGALPVRVECVNRVQSSVYLWIIAHKSARDALQEALRVADFSAVRFAGAAGTPEDQMKALDAQLGQVAESRAALESELSAMAKEAPRLRLLYEITSDECGRQMAAARFASTGTAFLMEGWVPGHACEKLAKKLQSITRDCEIEFRDALDDEQPPTVLHNRRIIAPFESVVANYALPDPRGFDPTFVMAPFFACLFGMMVSDAGYGLVMAILIPLIIHFAKPKIGIRKMMWILAIGGVFTVFWGALFNTWFGTNAFPQFQVIDTLNEPLPMMGLCLGMGVVHLFAGLGVGAYMNIKRGKPLDALFDQVFWFTLLCGLGMMALPQTSSVGGILAIASAVGILLTAGRSKPTLRGKITGGLGALYGVTGWLSDILSYMRLFGMGLATGVIGMVFNLLAGMVMGGVFGTIAGVAILIVGHMFNAAINILGAYVHSCRLQYIEFFGKFYEEGGVPFKPLSSNPRYVAIRPMDADGVE